MNVFDTIAENAFTPYRGIDEAIQQFPIKDGAVYFAYDTKKIYFDMNQTRHSMGGGDSIHFVYGLAENTEITQDPKTLYWLFPKEKIDGDYYLVDDIIINQDGAFYRIQQIDLNYVLCSKILVAGTGSGSGGDGDTDNGLSLSFIKNPATVVPYGETIDCLIKIHDTKKRSTQVTLYAEYYASANDAAPKYTSNEIIVSLDADYTKEYTFTLEPKYLQSGTNVVVIKAKAGRNPVRETEIDFSFTYLNISFIPQNSWNPATAFRVYDSGFAAIYPYEIKAGDEMSKSYISSNFSAKVLYDIDDGTAGSNGKGQEINTTTGSIELTERFQNLSEGDHIFHIKAIYTVNGVDVNIGEYYYGICIYKNTATDPIIWSSFNTTEVENYDDIIIEYNVYDPASTTGLASVEYYINGEYLKSDEVGYTAGQWNSWSIPEYIVGSNTFTIACRGVEKNFVVEVKRNDSLNLDAVDGAVLYLTPKGRSNSEKLNLRQKWANKATGDSSGLSLGEVEMSGFNWANNGWMSETDKVSGNEISYLRITNGATVKIPLQSMISDKPVSMTYEFEFRVRNAVNYNRLVNAIPGETDEDPTKIELTPDAGAFLRYFDFNSNKGFLLGTQEVAFALSKTGVASAKYIDTDADAQDRVKISIVIDADGSLTGGAAPLIYIYVNSVLTNIYQHTGTGFAANISAIEIVSDYCDVDIYNIRIYKSALGYADITQNWVGDALSLKERHSRYDVNQALVERSTGDLSYEAVKNSGLIPIMVITTYNVSGVASANDQLPYYKGNTRPVGVRFYHPDKPDMNFHAQNVQLNVQGTSSQGYPRRNYKLKLKKVIDTSAAWTYPFYVEDWDGNESNKDFWYADNEGQTVNNTLISAEVVEEHSKSKIDIGNGIAVKDFCLKADFMDSSGVHNTAFADLIQEVSNTTYNGTLDFRHPLKKDFGLTSEYRSTVYGFPILIFWENSVGNIEYIGKYNFNIDKGATDAFGFSEKAENPYSPEIIHYSLDSEGIKQPEGTPRKSTFKEIAECWEFKQNQPGLGKFTCSNGYDFNTEGTGDGSNDPTKLGIYVNFEPRYLKDDTGEDVDFDDYISADSTTAIGKMQNAAKNFKVMWDWVHSTDVSGANSAVGVSPILYRTLSTTPETGITYYTSDSTLENLTVQNITTTLKFRQLVETGESTTISIDADAFKNFIFYVAYPGSETDLSLAIGSCSFTRNEAGNYVYQDINGTEYKATDYGITVNSEMKDESFIILIEYDYQGFSTDLLEKFEYDTIRYRKTKFRNELTLHLDLNYMLMYFIMTEIVLGYDSRQKNMMMASFGPRKLNGDYIWYPFFYDIDTQLGVNNSGYQTWDYDVDATSIVETATGLYEDSSLFAGAGSVLWINFYMLFKTEIINAYNNMREKIISQDTLEEYYNTNGSDKWSEIMKNLDADYKYIAPCWKGYINQEGKTETTTQVFYALQGDRALQRKAFFRNRLNYLDSGWQAGAYDPSATKGSQMKMRYNTRSNKTSDDGATPGLKADLNFEVIPYLSQYVSAIFDETATTPVLFKTGVNTSVTIEPPSSIAARLESGTPLSQQLIYIRGPQYLSDLGDLSTKYINEFSYDAATRLRRLKLGSMVPGYKNEIFEGDTSLNSAATGSSQKGLMLEMDISNVNSLKGNMDLQGCIKLETFKALGTEISSVTFTEGNLLKTIYLPKTITDFRLAQPLSLTKIIETKPEYSAEDIYPEGLYVENWTDKLDSTDYNCDISTFKLTKDKLGIDSYRMLKHLYECKENSQDELLFDVSDVDWSPYVQVDKDSEYELGTSYYRYINGVTYQPYTYNEDNWAILVTNGNIYTKQSDYKTSALTDLDMLTTFVNMRENGEYSITAKNYRYRSIRTDDAQPNKKIIPTISGRLHVNNDSSNPIDEYEVYRWTTTDELWPDLEITADYITAAPSAHFIEYTEDGLEDLGWLKYPTSTQSKAMIKYTGDTPNRRHYDFLGWVIVSDDNESVLQKQQSVLAEYDSITSDSEAGTVYTTEALASLDLINYDDSRLTLCAVYQTHTYNMYFYSENMLIDTVKVVAGQKVKETEKFPSKDSSDFSNIYECWKFTGWSTNDNDDGEDIQDITLKTAMSDMNFYAKFVKASVYDNILPESAIGVSDGAVYLKKGAATGKICFPATYKGEKITSLAAYNTIVDGESGNGLSNNSDITHIFFEGCNDPEINQMTSFSNGALTKMTNLVYVDIPYSLKRIGQSCFSSDSSLAITSLNNINDIGKQALTNAGAASTLTIRGDAAFDSTVAHANIGWKTIYIGTSESPITEEYALLYYQNQIFSQQTTLPLQIVFECDNPDKVKAAMSTHNDDGIHYKFCYSASAANYGYDHVKVEFKQAS